MAETSSPSASIICVNASLKPPLSPCRYPRYAASLCQRRKAAAGRNSISIPPKGEGQDHVLVLAALEGVADQVRDPPEEAHDLAVVHAGRPPSRWRSGRHRTPSSPGRARPGWGIAEPGYRVQPALAIPTGCGGRSEARRSHTGLGRRTERGCAPPPAPTP